jgi:very-short-patch-repair endonuclease
MSDKLHRGATGEIFNFARTLRKDQTEAERILWEYLESKRLSGYKFRRQHPIKNYIADFYCHEARLVIEVDGEIHMAPDQQVYDEGRTYDLKEVGVSVIRF